MADHYSWTGTHDPRACQRAGSLGGSTTLVARPHLEAPMRKTKYAVEQPEEERAHLRTLIGQGWPQRDC